MFRLKSADPLLELIGVRELISSGASQRDTSRETVLLSMFLFLPFASQGGKKKKKNLKYESR